MNYKHLSLTVSLAGLALLVAPIAADAQTTIRMGAGTSTPRVRAALASSTSAEATRAERAKEKAAKEIDRRIESLNKMLTNVTALSKVSDVFKGNLKTNVQTQIDSLTALKAKIESDTDLPTLKEDIKKITESYRVYMVVMPQARISAAADRMATIINMFLGTGTKLQARINTAKADGKDTTEAQKLIDDMAAKLASAKGHAEAALNAVTPLVPDNGDKAVATSNQEAIKKAQAELKLAQADITAARKDMAAIVKALGTLKALPQASSTTPAASSN